MFFRIDRRHDMAYLRALIPGVAARCHALPLCCRGTGPGRRGGYGSLRAGISRTGERAGKIHVNLFVAENQRVRVCR
jgi:hypothetical protein